MALSHCAMLRNYVWLELSVFEQVRHIVKENIGQSMHVYSSSIAATNDTFSLVVLLLQMTRFIL